MAQKLNKKEAFVYSFSAYMYENELGDIEKALAAITAGLKQIPNNTNLQDHQQALQNNKRFKMSKYGENWYQLMLEKNMVNKLQQKYLKAQQRRVNIKKKQR